MRYIKVEGNLLGVLGENIRKGETTTGLRFEAGYQFLNLETPVSLGYIIDEDLAIDYLMLEGVTVLETIDDFNTEIDNKFEAQYTIYSDSLVSANLTQKISNNELNLDEMDASWSAQEEAKFLYEQGISGIKKSCPPSYLTE